MLLPAEAEPFPGVGDLLSQPSRKGMRATGRAMWPAAAALFLSIAASMLVSPFFTYVPSSGWLGDLLPQVWHRSPAPPPFMQVPCKKLCDYHMDAISAKGNALAPPPPPSVHHLCLHCCHIG